jgi:hypothetical protein
MNSLGRLREVLTGQDMDGLTLRQQILNRVDNALLVSRQFFQKFWDPRRNLNDECGYPETGAIQIDGLRELYDREPVANRACALMPKECWEVNPLVYEDEDPDTNTPFEQAIVDLNQGLRGGKFKDDEGSPIWEHLKRVDILSGIGSFGILLMGFDDGLRLDEPVPGIFEYDNPDFKRLTRTGVVSNMAGDCYLSKGEETWLTSMKEDKTKPLNEAETLALNSWVERREKVTEIVRNAKANRSTAPGPLAPGVPGSAAYNPMGQGPIPGQSYVAQPADEFLKAIDPRDQLAGTDAFYQPPTSSGQPLGTPGSPVSLPVVGTDRQYFDSFSRAPMMDPIMGSGGAEPAVAGTPLAEESTGGGKNGDGKNGKGKNGKGKFTPKLRLLFLRSFDESLVQIVRYEWNLNNPRFGMPVMYRVTFNDPRETHTGIGLPLATVFVHWSRILHVTDSHNTAGSSEIFSPGRIKPILNPLLDIQKIRGAAGEGYYKGGFPGLTGETHPQLGGEVDIDEEKAKDAMEQWMNGLQRTLLGVGISYKTLAPNVTDPTPYLLAPMQAVALQIGCPMRVFLGSERGEMASSQDDENWNDRKRERQINYLTPRLIVPFFDRLIRIGVLPEPEGYSVEWPALDAISEKDKATIIFQKTQSIAAYAQNGESIMPLEVWFKEVWGWDHEKIEQITDAIEKQQKENQDMADQYDFEPEPPEGFHKPPPTPIIQPQGGPGTPGEGGPGAGKPFGAGQGGGASPAGGASATAAQARELGGK